jgi:glycosyltransferase involved in cell wall biosynthesis
MWEGRQVSVVFPAYNEEAGIAAAVRDFLACPEVDEVVVVNNNSRDRTAELAAEAGARVVTETRQGYGHALRRGLQEARGDYIILSEPDGTFIGRDVHKLLAYAGDFDLVMGTRTTQELIWQEANMGWFLRVGNVAVAKLLQYLFGGPSLSDCGCTMRLIQRDAATRMHPRLTVGSSHFLPEMVVLALLDGLHVIEVPVNYRGRLGESKITGSVTTAVRVGLNMIGLILSYRVRTLAQPRPSRVRRSAQLDLRSGG